MMLNELMMMGGAMVAVWIIPIILLPFLYIYLLQDLVGRRDGTRDPNLGVQIMLTCLMTVGTQVAVIGAALIAASFPAEDPGGDLFKTGMGLILGGAIGGGFPSFVYLTHARAEGTGRIGHKALGMNAALFGLTFSAIATVTSVAAFHEEKIGEPVAMGLVYLVATVVAVMRLTRSPLPPAYARGPSVDKMT
jgi:hypothetical protein